MGVLPGDHQAAVLAAPFADQIGYRSVLFDPGQELLAYLHIRITLAGYVPLHQLLCRGVAQHPDQGRIDHQHFPLRGAAVNALGHTVEDLAVFFLRLLEGAFHSLPLGQVMKYPLQQFSAPDIHQVGADLHRDLAAVFMYHHQIGENGFAVLDMLPEYFLVFLPLVGGMQFRLVHFQNLIQGAPYQLLGFQIGVHQPARLGIPDEDGIVGLVHQYPIFHLR